MLSFLRASPVWFAATSKASSTADPSESMLCELLSTAPEMASLLESRPCLTEATLLPVSFSSDLRELADEPVVLSRSLDELTSDEAELKSDA